MSDNLGKPARAPRRPSHPLLLLFWSRKYTERAGMNWLQDRGHISDLCVQVTEVAPPDILRVLALANALAVLGPSGPSILDQMERFNCPADT